MTNVSEFSIPDITRLVTLSDPVIGGNRRPHLPRLLTHECKHEYLFYHKLNHKVMKNKVLGWLTITGIVVLAIVATHYRLGF